MLHRVTFAAVWESPRSQVLRRLVSYIANWIELLRADDRAFFTAASQAQKAADYLRGLALTESLLETVA